MISFSGMFTAIHLVMLPPRLVGTVTIMLWVTGFLTLLNIVLAILFRKKRLIEVLSYYLACSIELTIFVLGLLAYVGIISRLPYQLPQGLPINSVQILAALAIGIGLFPAAFWHRVNVSDLPGRIAKDAKMLKDRDAAVHVRKSGPGEWMN